MGRQLLNLLSIVFLSALFVSSVLSKVSFAQSPTPTDSPTPTQAITNTPTSTPTSTPIPTTSTPTPTQSRSSTPTPTPSPSPTPDTSQQQQDLKNQIQGLQNKITDLQGQEKTLSNQIGVMDSQIKITQYKIAETKTQIDSLQHEIVITTRKVTQLDQSLSDVTKKLLHEIVTNYEIGNISGVELLAGAKNVNDFITKVSYMQIIQDHDKLLLYEVQTAKDVYANQKQVFEAEKKKIADLQTQLESYNNDLTAQQNNKKNLLSQTQGSEANYQQQLAHAQAQLAAFSDFVDSQGGASILSNQTVCDDWGCYYNQRDSQWGNLLINGQKSGCGRDNGPCTIAKVGCLITSVSMVASHMGHKDIFPSSIALSAANNFGLNTTADLMYSINVNGVSINRTRIGSSSGSLPNTITNPIIVGISYDAGPLPDHFVVLVSGSNGNYMMNDPFAPNGHTISFTSRYSLGSIREVDTVSM